MDDLMNLFPWLVGGGTIVLVIFTILCTVLPTVAIIGGVFYFIARRGKQAQAANLAALSWLTTTGTVAKSRVEVSGGDHTSVWPRVMYEYEVGGVKYQSDRIKAGDAFMRKGTSRSAYDIVDRYPEGQTVTVYYNPLNPAESALER